MSTEQLILDEIDGGRFRSGEEISRRLEITRSAVWKHIVKLRESGYEIEARPHMGYRLVSRPDKLLALEIAPRLDTTIVGSRIVHFDRVASTTEEARKLVEKGTREGTVVIAEAQTAGKGRLGRSWVTDPGQAIAMSLIMYSGPPPTRIPLLSLATAVAAARAVRQVTGVETGLKWPNDIYHGDRKLGGVLVEISAELDRIRWIIDSIGLNVNDDFRKTALEKTAVSLADITGKPVSRRDLLVGLLSELETLWLTVAETAGDEDQAGDALENYRREFQQLDMLQGRGVSVSTTDGVIDGVASGIDGEGRLLVDTGDGTQAVFSGEATLSG